MVSDDLVPGARTRVPRPRFVAQAAILVSGVALAGGAAYGLVPGELGHHGAQVVNIAAPRDTPPVQLLAKASHPGLGPDPNVVYVDAATPSEGPSMVSVAHPTKTISVLATRGLDGHCTFLRVRANNAEVATTAIESCIAHAAPKHGWSPYHG